MNAKMLFSFVLLFLFSCGSQQNNESKESTNGEKPIEQLNISILLDL